MGVDARRGLALAGAVVTAAVLVLWAQGAVPAWLRDWVRVAGVLAVLAGAANAYRRWWPEDPTGHPPRRADPAVPGPTVRSARPTLLGLDGLVLLGLPTTLLFVALRPGWLRGPEGAPVTEGPIWFRALTHLGGAVLLGGIVFALVLQALLLHRSVRRVTAGQEPRWLATVLRNSPGALTLRAARLDRRAGPARVVRVANTVRDFAALDPGDELVLDGPLRRWGWVAVAGVGRTRWVHLTWRQPRAGWRRGGAGQAVTALRPLHRAVSSSAGSGRENR